MGIPPHPIQIKNSFLLTNLSTLLYDWTMVNVSRKCNMKIQPTVTFITYNFKQFLIFFLSLSICPYLSLSFPLSLSILSLPFLLTSHHLPHSLYLSLSFPLFLTLSPSLSLTSFISLSISHSSPLPLSISLLSPSFFLSLIISL